MYPLMAAYASSGQTQARFCAARGLKVATFQYWWRRYRADQGAGSGGFVALEPMGEASAAEVELHYGAVRIQLSGVPADYVAALVQKLGVTC